MVDKDEAWRQQVLEVALNAAQESTGNRRLTIESEVDWETAIAIGDALSMAFSVEIDPDSIKEWGGSKVKDFVEYMELLSSVRFNPSRWAKKPVLTRVWTNLGVSTI